MSLSPSGLNARDLFLYKNYRNLLWAKEKRIKLHG